MAAIDSSAGRHAERLTRAGTFPLALLAYFAVLFLIRAFLYAGGSNDDSEQILYSQSLEFAYGVRNPPLFTWLVVAAQQALGASVETVTLVKLACLAAMYLLFYGAARLSFQDERWAVAVAISPLAMYYVSWDSVRNYSHTVLVLLACVAAFAALVRVERSRGWLAYAGLGLAIGLGILTKYNFFLFLAALAVAGFIEPAYRRALLDRRILLTVAVALIVAGPYLVWMLSQWERLTEISGSKFRIDEAEPWIERAGLGLASIVSSLFNFLAPLVLILPLVFWRTLRPLGATAATAPDALTRVHRLSGLLLLALLAGFVALVMLSGAAKVSTHLFVIFICFPVWFLARARLAGATERSLNCYVAIVVLLAAVVPVAAIATFFTDPLEEGGKPYFNVPYKALAKELRAAGFTEGTVFTEDWPYPLSGNLRGYFPESRFVTHKHSWYIAPSREAEGQCLLLWEADRREDVEQTTIREAKRLLDVQADEATKRSTIELPMINGWGRTVRFDYRLIPNGSGTCH